jgi:transposase
MPRLNLRDDQWERIAHLLPGKPGDRGRTAANNRWFVEAVLWMARSGAPWRDLPEEFGPWNSGNFSKTQGTASAAAARSRMMSGNGAMAPCWPMRSPR